MLPINKFTITLMILLILYFVVKKMGIIEFKKGINDF